jgi:hypothetical protein
MPAAGLWNWRRIYQNVAWLVKLAKFSSAVVYYKMLKLAAPLRPGRRLVFGRASRACVRGL